MEARRRLLVVTATQLVELFDEGKRPSEIYDLVGVKKHTLFYYYQLWKKEHPKAELERWWKRRLEGCENEIQQIKRYPESHQKGELAKWQAPKPLLNDD